VSQYGAALVSLYGESERKEEGQRGRSAIKISLILHRKKHPKTTKDPER